MSRSKKKPSQHAVLVERTVETTGSTIRLLLEPLPNGQVLIVEYRRRRSDGGRFERQKGEEGKVVAFELLNLEEEFDELFPQAAMF